MCMRDAESECAERGILKRIDEKKTLTGEAPSDRLASRCIIHSDRVAQWHALTNPLQVLKMGVENIKQYLHQVPNNGAVEDVECCESALSALEACYHRMRQQHLGMRSMGGIDLSLVMRHEIELFKAHAQQARCSVLLNDFYGLPGVDIDYQCLTCFLNRLLAGAFEAARFSQSWSLELKGIAENGCVCIHTIVHHPEKERILGAMWDRIYNDQIQFVCQSPLKSEFKNTATHQSFVFTVPALINSGVWARNSCG